MRHFVPFHQLLLALGANLVTQQQIVEDYGCMAGHMNRHLFSQHRLVASGANGVQALIYLDALPS